MLSFSFLFHFFHYIFIPVSTPPFYHLNPCLSNSISPSFRLFLPSILSSIFHPLPPFPFPISLSCTNFLSLQRYYPNHLPFPIPALILLNSHFPSPIPFLLPSRPCLYNFPSPLFYYPLPHPLTPSLPTYFKSHPPSILH